ncbi:hypothetical protein BaRGS_00028076 [Batillaria attramentaria]|uniref:Uncharacterized protein n=1 Tax=Batillaria attramentaria TaxID=370345 RepID=A0ABD0K0M3_9CAEN
MSPLEKHALANTTDTSVSRRAVPCGAGLEHGSKENQVSIPSTETVEPGANLAEFTEPPQEGIITPQCARVASLACGLSTDFVAESL